MQYRQALDRSSSISFVARRIASILETIQKVDVHTSRTYRGVHIHQLIDCYAVKLQGGLTYGLLSSIPTLAVMENANEPDHGGIRARQRGKNGPLMSSPCIQCSGFDSEFLSRRSVTAGSP